MIKALVAMGLVFLVSQDCNCSRDHSWQATIPKAQHGEQSETSQAFLRRLLASPRALALGEGFKIGTHLETTQVLSRCVDQGIKLLGTIKN